MNAFALKNKSIYYSPTQSSSSAEKIVVLESVTKRLNKIYRLTKDGIKKSAYQNEYKYKYHTPDIHDIYTLSKLLSQLEDKSNFCLVRGSLTKYGLRHSVIRRTLHKQSNGAEPTFRAEAKKWICIDIDDFEFPQGLDPHNQEDRLQAIDQVIQEALPPELLDVTYHYQFSNSFGVPSKCKETGEDKTGYEYLKVHLWFYMSESRTDKELKHWFKDYPYVDKALFNPVQIHYTSKPHFIGLNDPIKSENRSGFIRKTTDEVIPPFITIEEKRVRQAQPKEKSSPKKRATSSFHRIKYANDIITTPLGHSLLKRYEQTLASTIQGGRRLAILKAGRELGAYLKKGIISQIDAEKALAKGAEKNGWETKVGTLNLSKIINAALGYGFQKLDFTLFDSKHDQAVPFDQANDELTKLYQISIEEIEENSLTLLSIPAGLGKTETALKEAITASHEGKKRVILLPNHKLAQEVIQRLKSLDSTVKIEYLEGVLRRCQLYKTAKDDERVLLTDIIQEEGLRQLCLTCPFSDTCPVFNEKQKKKSVDESIIVGVHAHAAYLTDLPEDTIVVYDEAPDSLTFHKSLSADGFRFIKNDYGIDPIIRTCSQFIEDTLNTLPAYQGRYAKQIDSELIFESIKPYLTKVKALFEAEDVPVAPSIKDAKPTDDIKDIIAKRKAFNLIKDLATKDYDEILQSLVVFQSKKATWIEKHSKIKMPSYPTIVLDATATSLKIQWQAIANNNEKQLHIKEMVVDPEYRNDATFIKATSLRPSNLYTKNENGVQWKIRSVGAFSKAINTLKRDLYHFKQGSKVGILTNKTLSDLLNRILSNDPITDEIEIQIKEKFKPMFEFFDVGVGYSVDGISSNKFSQVDALVILGTPRFDLSSAQATYSALGIDPSKHDEAYKGETEARLIQYICRARHIRRSGVKICYLGDQLPAMTNPNLRGLDWIFRDIKMGKVQASVVDDAWLWSKSELEKGHFITFNGIVDRFSGISSQMARRIILEIRSEFGRLFCTPFRDGVGRPIYRFSKDKVSFESMVYTIDSINFESAYNYIYGSSEYTDSIPKKQTQKKFIHTLKQIFSPTHSLFDQLDVESTHPQVSKSPNHSYKSKSKSDPPDDKTLKNFVNTLKDRYRNKIQFEFESLSMNL
mgnify:CR=1 FL=1